MLRPAPASLPWAAILTALSGMAIRSSIPDKLPMAVSFRRAPLACTPGNRAIGTCRQSAESHPRLKVLSSQFSVLNKGKLHAEKIVASHQGFLGSVAASRASRRSHLRGRGLRHDLGAAIGAGIVALRVFYMVPNRPKVTD